MLATSVWGLSLLAASPAHAKTFTVNSTQDFSDVDPGDGVCDTIAVQLLIPCTLRGAIQEANAFPGVDAIYFDIPLGGVKTIKPNSQLPTVSERVTIDGYTQPGAKANTIEKGATNAKLLIELSGVNAGNLDAGLLINAPRSTVRGLVVNRFGLTGIELFYATATRVEGNFIGTDPTGALDRGNDTDGVQIQGGGSVVGGSSPASRNLISGNGFCGVSVTFSNLDADVNGNLIGTRKDGTSFLGNGEHGVCVESLINPGLDGTVDITHNTIAWNLEDAVQVSNATGSSILSNSIFDNGFLGDGGLGIDLVGGTEDTDGNTANDTQDPDTGANNLQNKPSVTSALNSGPKTTIKGTLNSTPNGFFTIQFFSNPDGDGEGKVLVGQATVTTDANGNASFSLSPAKKVAAGQWVTATATANDTGDTSEFSVPREVTQRGRTFSAR